MKRNVYFAIRQRIMGIYNIRNCGLLLNKYRRNALRLYLSPFYF